MRATPPVENKLWAGRRKQNEAKTEINETKRNDDKIKRGLNNKEGDKAKRMDVMIVAV